MGALVGMGCEIEGRMAIGTGGDRCDGGVRM